MGIIYRIIVTYKSQGQNSTKCVSTGSYSCTWISYKYSKQTL